MYGVRLFVEGVFLMNDEIKLPKYRKLSIVSLVTGIVSLSLAVLYNFLWMVIANFLQKYVVDVGIMPYIILPFLLIRLGLAIVAVVCGSIDLKKVKAGIYSKKGKGFDIAGIVLGSIVILLALISGKI
ncbi:MAG: hypothetical protein ACYCXK_05545 [Candidatus Humimicrobiaceae bacterium]